jgi:hypothetical protein
MITLAGLVLFLSCAQPPDSGEVLGPSAARAPTDVTVSSVIPDSVPQDTTLDLRVLGSGFDASAEAVFLLAGQPDPKVRTNSTRFVTSKEVVANVTVAFDAVATRYDAQVTLRSNGKKGIGTEKLTVMAFVDLGTMGGPTSGGLGVNDEGSVVGNGDTIGFAQPFVWDVRTSTMRGLGQSSEAYAINNARTVAGSAYGPSFGPARWVYDIATDRWTQELLTSPNNPSAWTADINQIGQIVGSADSVVPGVGGGAVLWQSPSVLVPLDPTGRFRYLSRAYAINASGMVVGNGRWVQGTDTAWVWVPDVPNGSTGRFVVLPSFNGLPVHRAEGINDAGDVVGWASGSKGPYALLWRRNPAQPNITGSNAYLPPVNLGASLGRYGKAYDINNASKVVGELRSAAFVWDPVNGTRLLPSTPGGSSTARRLNESAPTIAAGSATFGGNPHAVRWVIP